MPPDPTRQRDQNHRAMVDRQLQCQCNSRGWHAYSSGYTHYGCVEPQLLKLSTQTEPLVPTLSCRSSSVEAGVPAAGLQAVHTRLQDVEPSQDVAVPARPLGL